MFAFGNTRRARRPSLTPMIDVTFLLLIFFMLAARFGHDTGIDLRPSGAGTSYTGPPRLIEIATEGLRLNGVDIADIDAAAQLALLMDGPDDTIVLRPGPQTTTQRLVTVIESLTAAGFTTLAIVE